MEDKLCLSGKGRPHQIPLQRGSRYVHSHKKLCAALKWEHLNMRKIKMILSDGFFCQIFRCAYLDLISLRVFPLNLWAMSG